MGHVDIAVSHDWPRGIYYHGNTEELLRSKPFFRDEVIMCDYNNSVYDVSYETRGCQ